METIEGNKVIAVFDGWVHSVKDHHGINLFHYPEGDKTPLQCKQQSLEGFNYHSSWDALMPVVEKIERLNNGEFTIHINKFQVYINKAVDNGLNAEMVVRKSCDGEKLGTVWTVVIEFIEWYNNQKT